MVGAQVVACMVQSNLRSASDQRSTAASPTHFYIPYVDGNVAAIPPSKYPFPFSPFRLFFDASMASLRYFAFSPFLRRQHGVATVFPILPFLRRQHGVATVFPILPFLRRQHGVATVFPPFAISSTPAWRRYGISPFRHFPV